MIKGRLKTYKNLVLHINQVILYENMVVEGYQIMLTEI